MKTLLHAAVVAAWLTAAATLQAGGIVGSYHDMTAIPTQIGAVPGTSNICVYCHSPHTISYSTPLWNKPEIPITYKPYSSETLDGDISYTAGAQTVLCLTCHDGTIAVNVIVTPPSGGGYVTGFSGAPSGWNLTATGVMYGPNTKTGDLSSDHPVSITYSTRDRQLVNPPPATYKLYNGRVECGSCHNVHDNTYPPFLRTSNSGSMICLGCHRM